MSLVDRIWYSRNALSVALLPLAGLFSLLATLRRSLFRIGLMPSAHPGAPVIVVGNISVGGTGKTPLVIWLAEHLRQRGLRPGIIARGYGGKAQSWPQQVRPDSDPVAVGDEPVLLARRAGCPVCVGPNRLAAAQALLAHSDCDVLISDDGLQHYALARDIEIAVIDGERRLGNGWLLPAGPLREGRWRLDQVDLLVCNGRPADGEFGMRLQSGDARALLDDSPRSLVDLADGPLHAVAGIGNPERFFQALERQGLRIERHAFADHHAFVAGDLDFGDDRPLLMTEKDAVKCRRYARPNHYYLPVQAEPEAALLAALDELLPSPQTGGEDDGQETA